MRSRRSKKATNLKCYLLDEINREFLDEQFNCFTQDKSTRVGKFVKMNGDGMVQVKAPSGKIVTLKPGKVEGLVNAINLEFGGDHEWAGEQFICVLPGQPGQGLPTVVMAEFVKMDDSGMVEVQEFGKNETVTMRPKRVVDLYTTAQQLEKTRLAIHESVQASRESKS
jgi:hypothetical protein